MSLSSWVRALTEAKEKGMGHAPIACDWDLPSSEWAKGWGPYTTHSSTLMMNDHIHAHTPNMLMSLCICNANVIANSHVTCMMHITWNILINRISCQVPCNIYRKHISSLHFMPIFTDIVVSCILAFINT